MRRFLKDDTGAVLLETLISVPILVLFTFFVVQIGYVFFVSSTMIHVSQHVSREIAVGSADDETNGVLTACEALTGVSADGLESAEQLACDLMGGLPGSFSVLASDTVPAGHALPGNPILVSLQLQTSTIVPVDVVGMEAIFGTHTVQARHVKE